MLNKNKRVEYISLILLFIGIVFASYGSYVLYKSGLITNTYIEGNDYVTNIADSEEIFAEKEQGQQRGFLLLTIGFFIEAIGIILQFFKKDLYK